MVTLYDFLLFTLKFKQIFPVKNRYFFPVKTADLKFHVKPVPKKINLSCQINMPWQCILLVIVSRCSRLLI